MSIPLLSVAMIFSIVTVSPMRGQSLDSLYNAIDDAIANHEVFLRQKVRTIDSLRLCMNHASVAQQRYDGCLALFRAFESYQNDSATTYLHRCMRIAGELGRGDLKAHCQLLLVKQLSRSGYFSEAEHYLNTLDRRSITQEMLPQYHETVRFMYGEMGSYTHDGDMFGEYFSLSDRHRDTLFTLMPRHSELYLSLQENLLLGKHEYAAALLQNDELLKLVAPTSVQYATVAYYRAMEYEGLQQREQAKLWLARSALCDITNSVMDQASLWTLAEILNEEGQTGRSSIYVDYSWNCTQQFSARLRSWTVSPVVSKINTSQNESLQLSNTRLKMMFLAVSILAILVVGLYLFVSRKRHQLSVARKELRDANDRLTDTNALLSEQKEQLASINDLLKASNSDLAALNARLTEANLIKEEYIGQFFSICSDYIEKMEQQRINVSRKLRAHQYEDLLRQMRDTKVKEKEVEELNANFDMVFQNLFPNFVDDFNNLLHPEHRIPQPDAMRLPTVVRIFALVRLGIEDSYHISQFLHYTPNTIYNYRSRTKMKAIRRETFEEDVRQIGKQS